MKLSLLMVAMSLIFSCALAGAADRKYIVKPRASDMKGLPFSDAVLAGNTLYISGHIGIDPKTGVAAEKPEEEAKLVMEGVKSTVEAAGLTMDDVVQLTIYCTDLKLYGTFNDAYKNYFHGDFPARAFIGVDKLVRNGRFEVEGVAVKRGQ
jgi:reactive intermediate/imine deaminase